MPIHRHLPLETYTRAAGASDRRLDINEILSILADAASAHPDAERRLRLFLADFLVAIEHGYRADPHAAPGLRRIIIGLRQRARDEIDDAQWTAIQRIVADLFRWRLSRRAKQVAWAVQEATRFSAAEPKRAIVAARFAFRAAGRPGDEDRKLAERFFFQRLIHRFSTPEPAEDLPFRDLPPVTVASRTPSWAHAAWTKIWRAPRAIMAAAGRL